MSICFLLLAVRWKGVSGHILGLGGGREWSEWTSVAPDSGGVFGFVLVD